MFFYDFKDILFNCFKQSIKGKWHLIKALVQDGVLLWNVARSWATRFSCNKCKMFSTKQDLKTNIWDTNWLGALYSVGKLKYWGLILSSGFDGCIFLLNISCKNNCWLTTLNNSFVNHVNFADFNLIIRYECSPPLRL